LLDGGAWSASIARLIRCHMSRPSSDEWDAMLRAAGAPGPWADPTAREQFAASITFPVAGGWQEEAGHPRRRQRSYRRVAAGVAERHRGW
jgi:hypothetical protein